MIQSVAAVVAGFVLLLWSADRFVDGAATTARFFRMPPLLIGMVIVGFGTSAPELVVSALAALQGNSGIALGNAYGSNIVNIALILGITALINPIRVHSTVLRKQLPILSVVTGLTIVLLWDLKLSRLDALAHMTLFAALMAWTIYQGMRTHDDSFAREVAAQQAASPSPLRRSLFWLVAGLVLLIVSSRVLVWGAVEVAHILGVSDMIIGLSIVAIGTSLPELASSIIACRKNEHDIALGNVLGSNLFNTLAVVGIAGSIRPIEVSVETLSRDMPIMAGLTLSLFIICYAFKGGTGRINRVEGLTLLLVYAAYAGWLVRSAL